MKEADLVTRLQQGDREAMDELLLHHGALLRYVIAPIVQDAQEREDCLSEVLMTIWERCGQYDPHRGNWHAWLTAVARNAALNHQRGLARHQGAEEVPEELPAPEPGPEELLLQKERQAALLLVGGLCGYLFGGRYAMDWQPVDAAEHSQVAELKTQLAELGFPEDVLDDLTAEDIAACAGARDVVCDAHESSFEGTDEALRITGVAVHLAGERERWVIFHHFLWLQEPDFHGADVFEIQPTSYLAEGWFLDKTLGGRVLCERNGVRYAAPYASLDCESYVTTGFFAAEHSSIFATFSTPKHGESFRGYVSYTVSQLQDDWVIDSWATYSHQESWLQYPVCSAKEMSMQSGWNQGVFASVQSALQFYPTENGILMFR